MRTEILLHKHNLAQEKTASASFNKGHLNGLILACDLAVSPSDIAKLMTAKVRVKFVSDKVVHIATELPLSCVTALSNLDFGSTNNVGRSFASYSMKTSIDKESVTHDNTLTGDGAYESNHIWYDKSLMAYLDLGSIYCEAGDELHVTVEMPANTSVGYLLPFSIFSVSREIEPFHFLKYDIDFDNNEMHQQVIRSFIYQREAVTDGQIYVDSENQTYQTNFNGVKYLNGIFGSVENVGQGVLFEVYRTLTGVPEDVLIKHFTDTPPTYPIGVLNVRTEFDIDRVTQKNVDELKALAEQVRKYEQKHPEQASAMIAAGMLRPSSEIEQEAISKI